MKFLDEDSDFIPLIRGVVSLFEKEALFGLGSVYPFLHDVIDFDNNYAQEQFKRYAEVIDEVYGCKPGDGVPIDNHSSTFQLQGHQFSGDSMRVELLGLDVAIFCSLGVKNIEFITNRFNNGVLKSNTGTLKNVQLSQGVIIKRIPVLQTPIGPIIDRIDSIRGNYFLQDFRKKIIETDNQGSLTELVIAIESEFSKYRNNVLLGKQKGSRLLNSLARNSISFVAGEIIPGVGEMKSLISDGSARKANWTGFLAEIENNAL